MATLHVRDMPDDLYARLRAEADASHRSVSETAIDLLARELDDRAAQPRISGAEWLARARARRARSGSFSATSAAEDIREARDR